MSINEERCEFQWINEAFGRSRGGGGEGEGTNASLCKSRDVFVLSLH